MKSKILYLTRASDPNADDEATLNEFLSTLQPSQIIHISILPLIQTNTRQVIIIHS